MSRLFVRACALLAVLALTVTMAVASPDKKKAEAPKCSACKMALVTKKDKDHPTAVTIKGKTYYCCAKCPMGKTGKKKAGKM